MTKKGMNVDNLRFTPRLKIINDAQIARIHGATLDVLEKTGVQITHKRALEALSGIGARVSGNRVRIPAHLVEKAIASAPSRIRLGNRAGETALTLGDRRSWFGPSLDCIHWQDPQTEERSRFTSEHCAKAASLAEVLENFTWTMIIGMADDYPQEAADKVIIRKVLENSTKPLVFCCNNMESVKATYEMALLAQGGKEVFDEAPLVVHYSEPISPLLYYDPALEKIIYCAEKRIPLINFPAPQCGGTAPATLAGNVVQGSAESLSGLVLHQAINPGAPFIYGAYTTVMNMRSSIFSYGAPELSVMVGALAQMAQYYKLPFFGTGGCTDAKFPDPQAAIEATQQCLTSAYVGSGLVHDCAAWIDHGSTVSPTYMVMVNEILSNVRVMMEGLDVSDESLAASVIDKVGPGGNYLKERHTLDNFKKVFYSDLFDRSNMDAWERDGKKTFADRLREKTLRLMSRKTPPLPADVLKEYDKMQATWTQDPKFKTV
ncbi:MAG: trimethylamine methyltransferase family protein [Deltaproteobacteria bacterium]|jgi:trimethylamine--corrinoid protein Co-methyltransferase|nr:trimethylamine methyltransferase family protein [Deltaproteobacteria bacterium]